MSKEATVVNIEHLHIGNVYNYYAFGDPDGEMDEEFWEEFEKDHRRPDCGNCSGDCSSCSCSTDPCADDPEDKAFLREAIGRICHEMGL